MMLFIGDDQGVLLYKNNRNKIDTYWAAESEDVLIENIDKLINHFPDQSIYMEFIPESFIDNMKGLGFEVYSEYIDFWNKDIRNSAIGEMNNSIHIRELKPSEFSKASEVTYLCKGQSRGFDGESPEMIKKWYESEYSKVFVATIEDEIVGVLMTSLYGFNSDKGIVLWLKVG